MLTKLVKVTQLVIKFVALIFNTKTLTNEKIIIKYCIVIMPKFNFHFL